MLKNKVIENYISLLLIQGANFLLPLITLPYLLKTLGAEKYGNVVFVATIIQYFILITEYGFNLSATRQIAILKDNKMKIRKIFYSVIVIKIIFMLLSFLLLCSLIYLIPTLNHQWKIYLLSYGMVVGSVFFPIWLFQGIERMKYITIFHFSSKLCFTILLFVLVHNSKDYLYVPLINSIGALLTAALSMYVCIFKFDIKFIKVSKKDLLDQLHSGFHLFISAASYQIYNISNTFFIGIFLGNTWAGYYNAGEKVITMAKQFLYTLFQAYYPHLVKTYSVDKLLYFGKWKKLSFFSVGISIIGIIVINLVPDNWYYIVLSSNFNESVLILKFLSISILLSTLMNLLGNQMMIVLGFSKAFSTSYLYFVLIYLIVAPSILTFNNNAYLLIAVQLCLEFFIVLYRLLFLKKKNLGLLFKTDFNQSKFKKSI
ncbi:oligosaccharide flippase family protein [Priestia megaterium]|uniref:oligosaccharide flippase family protein n=1 Tax=Priestia megaterium TaxID=1404 RepID=UPI00234F7E53|nr:oligosaccharide flippase family protein [Priestia megaterium]MDC7771446.1 oligosaccharide flippase family protein [Priestia megaterium]